MEDPATDVRRWPIVDVLPSRFDIQSCRQCLYVTVLKPRLQRLWVTIDVQEIDSHYHIDLFEFGQLELLHPETILQGLQGRRWVFGKTFTLVL